MTLSTTITSARLRNVQERIERLVEHHIPSRVASKEAALWGVEAESEASIRLGWVDDPRDMSGLVREVHALREQFLAEGVERFVLCGMGGSSLAPEVMAKREGVDLVILDSTHPDHVAEVLGGDLARTAVIVSSKSGTTVETAAAKASFEQAFRDAGIEPTTRVLIVTDPGSPLHLESEAAGHRVFLADPHVGGRFSALTAFGLVPTTLAGVDTPRVIEEAALAWSGVRLDTHDNPAVVLAAALSGEDRDIAVLLPDDDGAPGLGEWIEQLVAESTGKNEVGVLPVVAEGAQSPEVLEGLADVVVVDLHVGSPASGVDVAVHAPLGAQFLIWEYATAMAGYLIGVNPFDQPDVESAKKAARGLLDQRPTPPEPTLALDGLKVWLSNVTAEGATTGSAIWEAILGCLGPSSYLAVQIYGNRLADWDVAGLRSSLAKRTRRPVTIGFGPRFLHSTGQFHKGGTPDGVFIQFEVDATAHVDIPGFPFDFGALIDAQSAGDRAVLASRGRPVLTVRARTLEALTAFLAEGTSGQ